MLPLVGDLRNIGVLDAVGFGLDGKINVLKNDGSGDLTLQQSISTLLVGFTKSEM